MENRIIKLAIITLLGSTYTFAHAQNTKVLAEYENLAFITKSQDYSIIKEILHEGTDITSINNSQCQQQQQQHMSQYFEVCTPKLMIYRQKLFVKNGTLVFKSKKYETSFELNTDISQKIIQIQQQSAPNQEPFKAPLYIQCKTLLVERHTEINQNFSNYRFLNKVTYNKCIENGADQTTCEKVSMEIIQQQQAQQQNQQFQNYNGWRIEAGSCQIVMEN